MVAPSHPVLSHRVTHLGSVGAGGAGEAAGPLQALGAGRAALAGEAALALGTAGTAQEGTPGWVAPGGVGWGQNQHGASGPRWGQPRPGTPPKPLTGDTVGPLQVTLTLGPTSPGAPASPGTPCRKGTNGFGVRPGGFGGPDPTWGGDRGVSPDLRVCHSRRGDLVALAAPGRGQEPREGGDSETPGLGWHHPHPKPQIILNPKPQTPVLTWKPEGPGAPCSPLSPAGPCGMDAAQGPQKPFPHPKILGTPKSTRDRAQGPQSLWEFRLPPRQDFGDPKSPSSMRAGGLRVLGPPSKSRGGLAQIWNF